MTSPFNRKTKASKEEDNSEITIQDVSKEAQSLIDKVISDVGKTSATQQLIIGTASGWLTGYLMMKVGKVAAVAVGGGIILLQIANHKGYVKVNWDRIYKNVEDQVEKIDASTSKKGPKILDKDYCGRFPSLVKLLVLSSRFEICNLISSSGPLSPDDEIRLQILKRRESTNNFTNDGKRPQ